MYNDELVMGAHVYVVINEHATRQVPGISVNISRHGHYGQRQLCTTSSIRSIP